MTTPEAQDALLKMRTDLLRAVQLHKDRGLSPGPLQMQADALGAGIKALEQQREIEAGRAKLIAVPTSQIPPHHG